MLLSCSNTEKKEITKVNKINNDIVIIFNKKHTTNRIKGTKILGSEIRITNKFDFLEKDLIEYVKDTMILLPNSENILLTHQVDNDKIFSYLLNKWDSDTVFIFENEVL